MCQDPTCWGQRQATVPLHSSLPPPSLSSSSSVLNPSQFPSAGRMQRRGAKQNEPLLGMVSPPPSPGPDPLQLHQRTERLLLCCTQVAELPSMDTTCHPLLYPQRPLSQGSLAQRLSLTDTQCGRCLPCHSSAPPLSIASMNTVAWPQSDHQIFCFVLESFPCAW